MVEVIELEDERAQVRGIIGKEVSRIVEIVGDEVKGFDGERKTRLDVEL